MEVTIQKNPDAFNRLRSFNQALVISVGDFQGPVLIRVGQVHRKQMARIFATSGRAGASGKWKRLNVRYAERKRRVFGNKKILQLSGEMKRKFTKPSHPSYYQDFIESGGTAGTFRLGARSSKAAAHILGRSELAPGPSKSSRRIFGGSVNKLPKRDMISKTPRMVEEIRLRIERWYIDERIPQVLRYYAPLIRNSKPGGPRLGQIKPALKLGQNVISIINEAKGAGFRIPSISLPSVPAIPPPSAAFLAGPVGGVPALPSGQPFGLLPP
jgi:hypothetical protein